jgi:hypothetical protein
MITGSGYGFRVRAYARPGMTTRVV